MDASAARKLREDSLIRNEALVEERLLAFINSNDESIKAQASLGKSKIFINYTTVAGLHLPDLARDLMLKKLRDHYESKGFDVYKTADMEFVIAW